MKYIERDLGRYIKTYLDSEEERSNTLLLAGARQVGKTTLIEEILEGRNSIILNLFERTNLPMLIDETDSFEDFERLLLRDVNFKPSEGTVLVFDEAQDAKKIGRWIRFFKEKWRNQKVIVTGSILSNLFEEGVAYPVGRVEEVVLRPFSFKEYLLAIDRQGLREILESASFEKPLSAADREALIKPYLSYLAIGGMPNIAIRVYEGQENAYSAWDKMLRQYSLDIERYMGEMFKTMFVAALDRIADITCHPIKNSQIISTDSPSYRRLPHLLEIVEKWNLVHRVSAQTKHPESGKGLASKRYLFDAGLTDFLINQSQPVVWKERSDSGNIVYPKLQENFVCNELLAATPFPMNALNYYKETRNSREVDFIFPIEGSVVPIEVKSQASFGKNSLIPMINFLEKNGLECGVLVYNGEMKSVGIKGKTVHCIPPFFVSEIPRLVR